MSAENIRVLHVLASSLGGGASHVFDLMAHKAQGIEQKLVVAPDGGTIAARLRALGFEVEELDIAKGWKWSALLQLIRIIRKYRPSVVHCHGFRAGLYGRLAAKLASREIKTILTVHGFHYFYYRNRFKKNLFMLLERIMRSLTHHVIAVSNTDCQHLLECRLTTRDKSQVILNGIPPSAGISCDKSEIRSRLNLPDLEQPIIATVARLHYQKGVIYFLEAIPHILRAYPQARFLILGDGPERDNLQRAATALTNVRFLGNRDDAIEILRIVDVFVLPSLWEGLPLSLLEAMRAQVPIVATNVDGNLDVVEDGVTGLLVPPKNGEAIAKAVLRLLETPSLAQSLVEGGKIRLETDFSLENMLQKTRQIYIDLTTSG